VHIIVFYGWKRTLEELGQEAFLEGGEVMKGSIKVLTPLNQEFGQIAKDKTSSPIHLEVAGQETASSLHEVQRILRL